MKRIMALLIAALLLFITGCAKTQETDIEPTAPIEAEQPIITVQPIPTQTPEPPELKNSEKQCLQMLEYLNEISDMADKSQERLVYAKYSLPDDWQIDPNVPMELYQYPYNIDSFSPINPYGDFLSNKEFLELYSAQLQDEIIRLASAIGDFHANANGTAFEDDEYTQNAVAAVCPSLLLEDIRSFKEYDLEHAYITNGRFVTSPTLIYQALDGTIRIRGRLYMKPVSGSSEAINDLVPGQWYYADMEYILLPVEIAKQWFNLTSWTMNDVSIIGYFYLHQNWYIAESDDLVWKEITEPVSKEEPSEPPESTEQVE